MTATSTLRSEYPDFITQTSPSLLCSFAGAESVDIGGKTLHFLDLAVGAFVALNQVLTYHGYGVRRGDTGSLNCRTISGSSKSSLHAHGIALDINWLTNRYRHTIGGGLIQWGRQTDMPKEMVQDIEAIRTISGKRVFEWGGRWWNIKDPMHYQVRCLRQDLATGIDWSTVIGNESDEMRAKPTPVAIRAAVDAKIIGGSAQYWVDLPIENPEWVADFWPAYDSGLAVQILLLKQLPTGAVDPTARQKATEALTKLKGIKDAI